MTISIGEILKIVYDTGYMTSRYNRHKRIWAPPWWLNQHSTFTHVAHAGAYEIAGKLYDTRRFTGPYLVGWND